MSKRTAVAQLLTAAREQREVTIAALARRLEWSPDAVSFLMRGVDRSGGRYLGLRGRGPQGPGTLVVDIARELRVSREDLADALLTDLGWPARARKRKGKS